MGDPFSIIAGTVSIADVCFRIARYLKDVQAAAASVEEEIAALLHEVEALVTINQSIQKAFEVEISGSSKLSLAKIEHVENLWKHTGKSLRDCQGIVEKLEILMKEIYGKTGPKVAGKIDGLSKQSRKRSKDAELRQFRDQLSTYQSGLQVLLTAISLYNQLESQGTTDRSLDRVSKDLRTLDQGLRSQIASLQHSIQLSDGSNAYKDQYDLATLSALKQLCVSIDSAATVVSMASSNKHFDIPQPVSSIFTGREAFLENLKSIFITPSSPGLSQQQKRFVIQGIGGSGKTQFCSKFAQDNRDSFWGVFWIDASSHERIRQTFSQIAKIGEVEPNENAAMHWLSNLEERWLLIIDNADDSRIGLDRYFPKGDRGHILVTTRNPAHKVYGNVGLGFFQFESMEDNDASDLLLRAARQPKPWDSASLTSAATITKALGFLALALTHAGAAIRNGLCTLKNYLMFYEENWQRIRRAPIPSADDVDETDYMSVYTTYEISYLGIESKGTEAARDAIQLLKAVAFLYFENIRTDILKKAVTNGKVEEEQQEKDKIEKAKAKTSGAVAEPWSQTIKAMRLAVLTFILKNRGPSVLPHVIRDARDTAFFDNVRLRYALRELVQMSLITYNELNDSYSMHPLVHKWARERPGMTTPEQGVWSQAAATILAHSILLPPLGGTEADEEFRRDLLPHIDHVRKCQRVIENRIIDNRKSRSMPWPIFEASFDKDRALMYAKFSIVYAQCGRWDEAEQLQLAVKNYCYNVLGIEHATTRRIMLALAGTYCNLGRVDEAADLQNAVLQSCITSLGRNNHETLMAMDTLGQSRWQQGRFSDARTLQEEAIEGLTKLLGRENEDTLSAIDNLGRTIAKFYDCFGEAKNLHSQAVNGMNKTLGPTHLRTLTAVENLAGLAPQLGGDFLSPALDMILEVFEQRKKKLGKEHPYTLLAMVHMARIKSALGHLKEAEELMRTALPIADRNLGDNHIGTLYGRSTLAAIIIRQGRYGEAEDMLVDVSERQRHLSSYRGDFHPDRLAAMIELVGCYKLQGKIEDSIRICDEALEGFKKISTREHPLAKKLKEDRKRLVELQAGRGTNTTEVPSRSECLVKTATW